MNKKFTYFLIIAICFSLFSFTARATASATLSLTNTSGDNVQITVTGEPSSNIRLSFLPPGASSITTIVLGTTDSSGNFSTAISSGGYAIPQGSPVYITVSGAQSQTMLWPTYSSSLTLTPTSVNIAIGQSATVSGSSSLILPANGMSTVASTVLSGSQLTITGRSAGSGVLWLCSSNIGCKSVSVLVGDQGQSQVSFSENNFTLKQSVSKNIDIYGGSSSGFTITSNSNSSVLYASIGGSSPIVSLYGTKPGTATLVICSKSSSTNCANLNVTILSSEIDDLSFSQNDLVLNSGLSQTVTISGGTSNSYYIASNSNSGVAVASISNSSLNITGGSNSGSTVIKVCSTSLNAICGNLRVTLYLNPTTASETTLSFSQNVVSVSKKDTVNVTVSGGNGTGYIVSSNSNSSAATASMTGNTNIVSIYGVEVGSSIITICSSSSGSVCASIYVSVGTEKEQIYFNQSNVFLKSGDTVILNIYGGNGTEKEIVSNTNSSVVSGTISSGNTILVLKGGTTAGTSVIKVCSTVYTTNCASLNVTLTLNSSTTTNTPSNNYKLIKYSNSSKIYLIENNKKRWIKSEQIFNYFNYKWSDIVTIGADVVYADGEDLVIPSTSNKYNFIKDLKLGIIGDDVKALQQFLNNNGFIIAQSGPGSIGNETSKFGGATLQALIKFQKANNIFPASGLFGPKTRAIVNSK